MQIILTQPRLLDYIKANLIGDKNLSIRGLANLCGVADKSIINGGSFNSAKLGEKLTNQGFKPGSLVEKGFDATATWLTLEYFAYESRAKAEGAKLLAKTFGTIGIMTTFEKLKEQPAIKEIKPVRDAVDYFEAAKGIETLQNPIIKALLEQRLAEDLGATKALPSSTSDDLVLCAVLARDLGYNLAPGQDSQLGKFVKRHHEPKGQAQHGRYSVNVYSRYEIEDTVKAFFR